jgi:hypothetical protein
MPGSGGISITVAFVQDTSQAPGSTDRRFNRTPGAVKAVRLLDADRDLARRLGPAAGDARAAAVAGAVALPRGRWNPAVAAKRIRGGFGLLVLRGLLEATRNGLEEDGATVPVADTYDPRATNFDQVVQKVRDARPDERAGHGSTRWVNSG